MQIDYGEEMAMKLKNNSNQRTWKAETKGTLLEGKTKERKGRDSRGCRAMWLAAIDGLIDTHWMASYTWNLGASGRGQERLRWHCEVGEKDPNCDISRYWPHMTGHKCSHTPVYSRMQARKHSAPPHLTNTHSTWWQWCCVRLRLTNRWISKCTKHKSTILTIKHTAINF